MPKEEENLVVKTITEEYEKKIADLENAHKEELEKVRKEEQEKCASQIKALMTGRKEIEEKEKAPVPEEKDFFELAVEDTKKMLGIKGGN